MKNKNFFKQLCENDFVMMKFEIFWKARKNKKIKSLFYFKLFLSLFLKNRAFCINTLAKFLKKNNAVASLYSVLPFKAKLFQIKFLNIH